MPRITVNGTDIYFEDTGGESQETVVFAHGLLMDLGMFDRQAEFLRDRYRVVRYDHRGQGRSARPKVRSIDLELLFADAVALIEHLGVAPCHFAGLSMGGFVALRLMARRPDLLRSAVLLDTAAGPEPNAAAYRRLNLAVRWLGARPVASRVLPIMFGRTFLTDPQRAAEREEWRARLAGLDRAIYRAVNGVIERAGVYDELNGVTVPALIIVGEEDVATPPSQAERLHGALAGSRLVRIPGAGHTSTVEAPDAVNRAIIGFLDDLPRADGG
ncbi:MAG: alpha/beta fold hydrolase [Acidimicrobiia bacterium]|nr:alpha/beta fold hydrolase [Acidimicrobiia bacterium]